MPRAAPRILPSRAIDRSRAAPDVARPLLLRLAHSDRAWCVLLVILVMASFSPLAVSDFTNWDDPGTITRNPKLNPPSWENLLYVWSPRHPQMDIYIPATYTLWSGVAAIAYVPSPDPGGVSLNPWVFHGTNVLLHALSALAAFAVLKRLVHSVPAAGVGAALFALHPVQVEPVGWASGTKDVLYGLFALVAIWQYLCYAQPEPQSPDADAPPRDDTRRGLHYAAATAAFVLAMLSKPTAIVTPLLVAVLDRLLLRRPVRRVAIALLPWLLLAIPIVLEGRWAQPVNMAGRFIVPYPLRPLIATDALAFYLYKLVWPLRLGLIYDRTPEAVLAHGWQRFTWLAPAAVAAAAWAWRRRAPWFVAAVAVYWVCVAPVVGLVPFDYQFFSTVADHYLYLAMLGPALGVAFLLRRFATRPAAWAACAAILLALAARTATQATVWHDAITLFEHAARVNPNSPAVQLNLCGAYLGPQRLGDALACAETAVRLKPDLPSAHSMRAAVLANMARFPEAEVEYQEALRLDPNFRAALDGLAAVREATAAPATRPTHDSVNPPAGTRPVPPS